MDVKPALREEDILPTVSLKMHAQLVRYMVYLLLSFHRHVYDIFNKIVTRLLFHYQLSLY